MGAIQKMHKMWKDKTMMRRRSLEIIEELIFQMNHRITSNSTFQMEISRDPTTLEKLYNDHPDRWFKVMKSYLLRLRSYYMSHYFFVTHDQFEDLENQLLSYLDKPNFSRNDLIYSITNQIDQWAQITQTKIIDFSKRGLEN